MSARRVELDDEAKAEAKHAYAWYSARSPQAAEGFQDEFLKAIDIIGSEAEKFPVYEGETRRYLLETYPYGILFEVIGDVVFVTAVMHLKREPGYWKR